MNIQTNNSILSAAEKEDQGVNLAPAEVCGDDARVEAVGGDAGAAQAAAQLPAEEDVGQLGLVVGRDPGVLPAFPVEVVEVDGPGLVGQGRDRHYPAKII